MDNIQPLMRSNNNDGCDWFEHSVNADQVYKIHRKTRLGSEALFEVTKLILQDNIK